MDKKILRQDFLQRRKAMDEETFELKCEQIRKQFVNAFHLEKINSVHCFLPILKQKEINTWLIIESLRKIKPEIHIVVSVSIPETHELHHYLLEEKTTLIENRWGIPEPSGGKEVDPQEIDLVLMPLLAFDEQGHRVGYGKGFYDRFLAKCREDVVSVGLSFEEPVPYIEGTHEYDYKMDYCVTPQKVWRFD
jgi:5-formyltetrahydrofolate cyclo-ligase